MASGGDGGVGGRHYSVAQQRAQEVLSHQSPLSIENIYYVLSALPQPKNTRRIGVIPNGQDFVHSQAAGLTTQHGAKPTLSSICLKCPLVVTVLSKFVLDYDPTFSFTTITINYNYAAAPHQDVNHEDGRARIIALGDFEGGELNIEGLGDINIRNNWYDFDGTILHSTKPFTGERYSLVYFTHLSWKLDGGEEVGRKLINLGVPWPGKILPTICETNISGEDDAKCPTHSDIFFLPLKRRHQYEDAFCSELLSLCSLYIPSSNYNLLPPINELYKDIHEEHSVGPYGLSSVDELLDATQLIADRAVTFTVWKRICSSNSLESLFQAQLDVGWVAPGKFGIEIYSPGKQLSTRQKRKVLLLAQLSRPSETITTSDREHVQLGLLLEYDWNHKDEDGTNGILIRTHLCEQIRPHCGGSGREHKTSDKSSSEKELTSTKENFPANPIASTALRHSLSQILCNLAKVSHHSLVYDPFCGSGSILRAAEQFGGFCLGSDAFEQYLNLQSYHCQPWARDIFLSNIYHLQIHSRGQFDAIICDPPYGRREKHVDEKGVDFANHQTNDERALSQFKILSPLLHLSSTALKVGGRLSTRIMHCSFPKSTTVKWDPMLDLPLLENIRVLHHWSEIWESSSGHSISRDTVVVERYY